MRSGAASPVAVLARGYRWHRPLVLLAGACSVLLVCCVVGMLADPRTLTGLPIWDKPAKFSVSIAIYASTLAWLISVLPRRRRFASVLGTIIALMLAGEMVVIVTQVVRGRTSHFDVATPFDAALWSSMAGMIGVLWLANLVLVVLLLTQRLPDPVLTWALRFGMIIAVVGMALAYLMTLPTPAQQASWDAGAAVTVAGAHTVGLPDGGPGLPILGWSTVGGDLRIPHFVGLHGLQAMIILGLALSILGSRWAPLAATATRVKIVFVSATAYVGLLAILTWQALRGQSIIHPDMVTALVTAGLVLITLAAYALVLRTVAGTYLVLALVGLVGTWYFNLTYRGGNYLGDWFANAASSSAAVDILVVFVVCVVCYVRESRRLGWRPWVPVVLAALSLVLAVAFAFPLFLALREITLAHETARTTSGPDRGRS